MLVGVYMLELHYCHRKLSEFFKKCLDLPLAAPTALSKHEALN